MLKDVNNTIKKRGLTATNAVDDFFYKLPTWLFTNDKYNEMSSNAKVAYALIKNRCGYSIKNNWIDDNGNIYFIFTIKELQQQLHLGKTAVINAKAELVKFGLLEIVHVGFNPKSKRNEPDRWYLLKPELNAQEIREVISQSQNTGALEQSGSLETRPRQSEPRILSDQHSPSCEIASALEQSGSLETRPRQSEPRILSDQHSSHVKSAHALEQSGSLETRPYLDKDIDNILDNYKIHKDTQLQADYTTDNYVFNFDNKNYTPEQVEMQNKDLNKHFVETYTDTGYPIPLSKEVLQLLRMWFTSNNELRVVIGKIYSAKRQSEENARKAGVNFVFDLEDVSLQERLTKTIRRFLDVVRSDNGKKIKNPANYFYQAIVNMFDQWQNEHLQAIHSAEISKKKIENSDDPAQLRAFFKSLEEKNGR